MPLLFICADPESFVRTPTSISGAIIGPPAKRNLNGVSMMFRLRADDDLKLNAGLVAL